MVPCRWTGFLAVLFLAGAVQGEVVTRPGQPGQNPLVVASVAHPSAETPSHDRAEPLARLVVQNTPAVLPKGVPEKVGKVLKHIDEKGEAPPGYQGGRTFLNVEKLLPQTDAKGRRIKYREWDVNPLKPGVNRGPERLVTGSNGSAYYTADHYKSFKKIR